MVGDLNICIVQRFKYMHSSNMHACTSYIIRHEKNRCGLYLSIYYIIIGIEKGASTFALMA